MYVMPGLYTCDKIEGRCPRCSTRTTLFRLTTDTLIEEWCGSCRCKVLSKTHQQVLAEALKEEKSVSKKTSEKINELAAKAAAERFLARPTWVSIPWRDYWDLCEDACDEAASMKKAASLPVRFVSSFGVLRIYAGLPWRIGDDSDDPGRIVDSLRSGRQFYGENS